MRKIFRWQRVTLIVVVILFIGPLWVLVSGKILLGQNWRTASRVSAQLAPRPSDTPEAIVQLYAARAFNWRGMFAVHTWIAVKPKDAKHYIIYQVVGWNQFYRKPVVSIHRGVPDAYWYGNKPELLLTLRGKKASRAIAEIKKVVAQYPYQTDYDVWPGPNSNTFTAYVVRHVPELNTVLPVTAIGKDYLPNNHFIAKTPSGTGYQFSFYGIFGATLAKEEGFELNLLGLKLGIDFLHPAIKLPGVGRIGYALPRTSTD